MPDANAVIICALLPLASLYGCKDPAAPREPEPADTPEQIAVGYGWACALSVTGAAYCWGRNERGQVGDGTTTNRPIPVPVAYDGAFTSIATAAGGGSHTCALTREGAAFCWGDNSSGQLGNGTLATSSIPVRVAGGPAFVQIDAGARHTCGLSASGSLHCWGTYFWGNPSSGAGTLTSKVPVPFAESFRLTAISLTQTDTCGLDGEGRAYCWGIGHQQNWNAPEAVPVAPELRFRTLVKGCGVTIDGATYCWGSGGNGELGNGTNANSPSPVPVAGGHDFVLLTSGGGFRCGLRVGGAAYCWGYNLLGNLGIGTNSATNVPTPVEGNLNFSVLSAGIGSTCGISSGGKTYCWGDNSFGQLGIGTTDGPETCVFYQTAPCSKVPVGLSPLSGRVLSR